MHARTVDPMRPDPPPNLWAGRGRMVFCTAWGVVLLLGLTRCVLDGDGYTACLAQHDGNAAVCCPPNWHKDKLTCCPDTEHALCDYKHADWCVCVPNEDGGMDAKVDAGTDAEVDAGSDSP
jgi:hypothetical protein